jgi:hypothetical protein
MEDSGSKGVNVQSCETFDPEREYDGSCVPSNSWKGLRMIRRREDFEATAQGIPSTGPTNHAGLTRNGEFT